MSNDFNLEGEDPQKTLSFYCPYCKFTLSESLDKVGAVCRCSQCDQDCVVPKKKLSLSGDIPKGVKLPTTGADDSSENSKKNKLSLSGTNEYREKVAIDDQTSSEAAPKAGLETTLGEAQPNSPQVFSKMVVGVLVLLVFLGGGYYVHTSGLLSNLGAKVEAGSDKPDEAVVFTKIDITFERIQKAILSAEINESDAIALNMLLEMSEEDESMNSEISIFKTGIAKREKGIRKDLEIAAESAAELAGYYQKWDDYISTLFDQKIQQASNAGKQLKEDWLVALLDIVQRAPQDSNQAKPFILSQIRDIGRFE